MKKAGSNIPLVKPSDFDTYLFENWKAPTFNLYEHFHIEKIENYKNYLTLPTPPHRRSVNFLLFLTKGTAVRTVGLNKYELFANTCFCLGADQTTGIESVSSDAEGFYLHFKSEIFKNQYLNIDVAKDFPLFSVLLEPVFEVSDPDKIMVLFKILMAEYHTNVQKLIPFYLSILLFEMQNNVILNPSERKDASTMLMLKYKKALQEHIYDFKSVMDFASHLSVSPNHLLKCVKSTTGKSARDLLEEMRILEAKVLLKQSQLSISDIGFKIGKYEASDFARFFKKNTGFSPNQYRHLES